MFWALAGQLGQEMVAQAERLERVTPDTDGLAHLTEWIGQFMALHEAWAPVFASFQAASRDHQPEARRSGGIADRTGVALLRAFGLEETPRSATLVNNLVSVLIRCSFYAEQAPAGTSDPAARRGRGPALPPHARRPDRGSERRPLPAVARQRNAAIARSEPAVDARPGAPPRRAEPDGGCSTPVPPCCPPAATTTPGSTTSSRLPASATAPSTGTSRTRTTSSGCWPRQAASRMIDLSTSCDLDAAPDELRAWLRDWLAAYRADGGVISTWQEMRTNPELSAFSQRVAASVFTRLVRMLTAARLRRPGGRRHHAPRPRSSGCRTASTPCSSRPRTTPSRTCWSRSGVASSPCPTDGPLGRRRCGVTGTVPAVGAVPERMVAAVVKGPGRLEVEDVPVPDVGDDDVLVAVDLCGVCGSDLHMVLEGWGEPGSWQGHEWIGRVAAVGGAVDALGGGRRGGRRPDGPLRHLRRVPGRPAVAVRRPRHPRHRAGTGGVRHLQASPLPTSCCRCPRASSHGRPPWPSRWPWRCTASPGRASGPASGRWCSGPGPIGALTIAALRALGVDDVACAEPGERRQALARPVGATAVAPPRRPGGADHRRAGPGGPRRRRRGARVLGQGRGHGGGPGPARAGRHAGPRRRRHRAAPVRPEPHPAQRVGRHRRLQLRRRRLRAGPRPAGLGRAPGRRADRAGATSPSTASSTPCAASPRAGWPERCWCSHDADPTFAKPPRAQPRRPVGAGRRCSTPTAGLPWRPSTATCSASRSTPS